MTAEPARYAGRVDPILLRYEWTAQRGDALRTALRVTPRSFRRPRILVALILVMIYPLVLAILDRDPIWLLFAAGFAALLVVTLFLCRLAVLRRAMKPGNLWWCEYGPSALRFNDSGPAEVSVAYAKIADITAHARTYEFQMRAKGGTFGLPRPLVSDEAVALVLEGTIPATPGR